MTSTCSIRCAGIERRDGFPQFGGAVGLRVPEFLRQHRVSIGIAHRELFDTKRMHTALGEIPRDLVFPDRLPPLERKGFEFHRSEKVDLKDRVNCGRHPNEGALSCGPHH